MMNSKNLVATLLGAIVNFLGGWLVYGMLLTTYMTEHTVEYEGLMKEEMTGMPYYIIGSILAAILLCYVISSAGVKSAGKGAMMGAIVAALAVAIADTYGYASMNLFGGSVIAADIGANLVLGALTGAVIGWWLGRGGAKAAA